MHVYDEQIARHYSAYRPPLHKLIVGEALQDHKFGTGLDIGCGTGYSTLALTDFCEKIIGIDQSQSMLDRATRHPKVEYLLGTGEVLPLEDRSIDLVTYAGVFFYLNAENTISELTRVCREDALVCVYDFEVLIDGLMRIFDLPFEPDNEAYDHTCNPSRLAGVFTLKQISRTVDLPVKNHQAAHILLSDKSRHGPLAELFNSADPFDSVTEKLAKADWNGKLTARIHYSLHQL